MDRYDCVAENDAMEQIADGEYVKFADVKPSLETIEAIATEMERWLTTDGVGSENVADAQIRDWKTRLTTAQR
jgi:hypothetical protein